MKHFFTDSNGTVVIAQKPNIPFTVWLIIQAMKFFTNSEDTHIYIESIAYLALGVWAILEITQGVNLFRRVLGAIVFILSIYLRTK